MTLNQFHLRANLEGAENCSRGFYIHTFSGIFYVISNDVGITISSHTRDI